MRKIILILFCLRFSSLLAFGQDEKPTIERVEITGVADSRLSQELRDLMNELVGKPFDQLAADEVAFHLQNELSERVSAIRQIPGAEPDRIKLLFEFGSLDSDAELNGNVNSRYTVEDVQLQGVAESSISDKLREDMHKLAGEKLDQDRAQEIEKRLARELSPNRVVSRKVVKGTDRDHVRLVYEVKNAPYLLLRDYDSYIVAHSKQSVSFATGLDFGNGPNKLTLIVANDGDRLIERYAGYGVKFENNRAGTNHLGFRLEYFDYREEWKNTTLLALSSATAVPGVYRTRRGFEPNVSFALDRHFNVSVGASVQEMQFQYPSIHSLNSNAGTAAVKFQEVWRDSARDRQGLSATYQVRAASHNLNSDFIYTRHAGEMKYNFLSHRSEFLATATAGALTGDAPMFERFSLGNTTTLRGWNKYDLNPVGANRVVHGSLEYHYTEMQVYYDVGSAWDSGNSHKTTHSIGFGVHGRDRDNWYVTLGVPVRSGRIQPLKPMFMAGVHF